MILIIILKRCYKLTYNWGAPSCTPKSSIFDRIFHDTPSHIQQEEWPWLSSVSQPWWRLGLSHFKTSPHGFALRPPKKKHTRHVPYGFPSSSGFPIGKRTFFLVSNAQVLCHLRIFARWGRVSLAAKLGNITYRNGAGLLEGESEFQTKDNYWLVEYLPLWKIWKSVGMIIPYIVENKIHVWNHQPD